MDRNNWYFEQPVTEGQMDDAFEAVERSIRQGIADAPVVFGATEGFFVSSGSAGGINVYVEQGVAYDQAGKRIALDADFDQSLTTATDGTSTTVASSGNERWVSVFVKAGRKFETTATDGLGNSVKFDARECMNALGDTVATDETPYVGGTAAGVDKCYLVVGAEAPIGTGVRPSLITDGVLIADVRMRHGVADIETSDVFNDRRQRFVRTARRIDDQVGDSGRLADSLSGALATGARQGGGIDYFGGFSRDPSELKIHVEPGRGYVDAVAATGDSDFVRVEWSSVSLAMPTPDALLPRTDLVYVTKYGEIRVAMGTPAPVPTSPSTPAQCLPLLYVRVVASTTHTNNWPIARASTRRAPFPFSSRTGIVMGCELSWTLVDNGVNSVLSMGSARNQILLNGSLVEFGNSDAVVVAQDATSNPFGSPALATDARPYYIYACKQFGVGSLTNASPVILIESSVAPTSTGAPSGTLGGPGGTVAANDAVCIGVGFVAPGTSNRASCRQSQDGWVFVNNSVFSVGTTAYSAGAGTDTTLGSAPLIADRAMVQTHFFSVPDGSHAIVSYRGVGLSDSFETSIYASWYNSTGGTTSNRSWNSEVPIVPGAGPHLRITPHTTGVTYRHLVVGYHLSLPRVGF